MFRVQFYPSEELTKVLGERANKAGVNVSKYVTDFLEAQLLPEKASSDVSITQLTIEVLQELKLFVEEKVHKKEQVQFSLDASDTYRNIPMTAGLKPSAVRASIGRSFRSQVEAGIPPFDHVCVANTDQGKPKLNSNRALVYEIHWDADESEELSEGEIIDSVWGDLYPNASNDDEEREEWDGYDF